MSRLAKGNDKICGCRSAKRFGTYRKPMGRKEDIQEYYYWHRKELSELRRLGAFDPGAISNTE